MDVRSRPLWKRIALFFAMTFVCYVFLEEAFAVFALLFGIGTRAEVVFHALELLVAWRLWAKIIYGREFWSLQTLPRPRQAYMVIERFAGGDVAPIGRRFKERGRMMPRGLEYVTSWVEDGGARCFQIIASATPELVDEWTRNWNDLVDFEIVPVADSKTFWRRFEKATPPSS